eukprot:gb/GFBE01024543.1/.p1 GENE.gb/GFBE01024543.1/~~gb/GFBE01024543.1/.p1  ORF type:complete len:167 (+),score=25.82 gb/GFBE01024543.1/:1-501(+)
MIDIGTKLHNLDPQRIVVKLPLTKAGVKAASVLKIITRREISLCMTACYSSKQGVVAAGLGAEYIAPYLGRMDDLANAGSQSGFPVAQPKRSGMEEVVELETSLRGLSAPTRTLVASLRSAQQITDLALQGCDTFTFAPKICDELFDVEATYAATADFERAAKGSK